MKIFDLINRIEKIYPLESSYDFDNSGKNIVSNDDIKGILVCLDVDLTAINFANKHNINLIISHHPLTFNSFKNINDDPVSNRIRSLLKYGINSYSMHTNFDVNIKQGMAKIVKDIIFDKKNIKKESFLESFVINKEKYGLGNIIEFKKEIDVRTLYNIINRRLNLDELKTKLYDINNKRIKKIVLLPGSGSGDVDKVIASRVDCFITSDLKHNQILDLVDSGISFIDSSHYGLEKPFVDYIQKLLKKYYKGEILTYYNDFL